MNKHFDGVNGARDVATRDLQMATIQIRRAINSGGICGLAGEVGSGKTFAARTIHDQLVGEHQSVWATMTNKATRAEVLSELHKQLTGRRVKPRTLLHDLTDDLVELLTDRPAVAFIDEAHLLRADGLQTLRTLHQKASAARTGALSLVLIGSDLFDVLGLAKELNDRVAARWEFTRLTDGEMLAALHAWHPLLAATDAYVLREIDERYCDGRWRAWAKILAAALTLEERAERGYLRKQDIEPIVKLAAAAETGAVA